LRATQAIAQHRGWDDAFGKQSTMRPATVVASLQGDTTATKDEHGAQTLFHAPAAGLGGTLGQCRRGAALPRPPRPYHVHSLELP
jgi:hypothetical protein